MEGGGTYILQRSAAEMGEGYSAQRETSLNLNSRRPDRAPARRRGEQRPEQRECDRQIDGVLRMRVLGELVHRVGRHGVRDRQPGGGEQREPRLAPAAERGGGAERREERHVVVVERHL